MEYKDLKELVPGDRALVMGFVFGINMYKTFDVLYVIEGVRPDEKLEPDTRKEIQVVINGSAGAITSDGKSAILAGGTVYSGPGGLLRLVADVYYPNVHIDYIGDAIIKQLKEMK